MPMFDDPKKELRRLENELLAEEETDWLDDDLSDLDDLLKDYEEEQEEEVQEEYDRVDSLKDMSDILLEEEADSDRTFYREDYKNARKKKKGIAGLVVVACLETAAIVGLLAWWYLCLR